MNRLRCFLLCVLALLCVTDRVVAEGLTDPPLRERQRVLIESADGDDSWGTIGVSENLIEASWQALVDSLEHGVHRAAKARQAKTA